MFNWLFGKIKNFGVGKAVEALDNLERPLGDRIKASMDKFQELDAYGIAKLMVDEIQDLLRAYFKLPAPTKK